ncbi:MAG: hypothetical protein ACI4UY_06250, partial [Kiritimatiellia bacterium]
MKAAVDRERTNGVHFKLWLEMWQRSMVVLCHKERKESKGFASFVAYTIRLPKQEAALGLAFEVIAKPRCIGAGRSLDG